MQSLYSFVGTVSDLEKDLLNKTQDMPKLNPSELLVGCDECHALVHPVPQFFVDGEDVEYSHSECPKCSAALSIGSLKKQTFIAKDMQF